MTLLNIAFATLAVVFAVTAYAQAEEILDDCDDCFSPETDLRYGSMYMDGQQYRAYTVSHASDVRNPVFNTVAAERGVNL